MNQELLTIVEEKFQELYHSKPLLVRSPGRINLIGEHTDYNEGFVLPAAIDKAIYFAFSKREDEKIELHALDFAAIYVGKISDLKKSGLHWPDYILGVVEQLQKLGKTVGGFNCVFSSDVPTGAGLSSSAALECGVALGLNELFGLGVDKITLVKAAQKAENEFVGLQCGIMDQFASMMGQKGKVIQLDCKTLDYQYEPLELKGYKIVLIDTNVKHSLASSEYNTRRQQCEAGVKSIQEKYPAVNSLRDATIAMLDGTVTDPVIYSRCKYVIEEKERLLTGCEDLEKGDIASFGQKMFRTHFGLSKEYEVSCPELDFLVDAVKDNPAVLGARMMGGGFGGCTINIVKEDAVEYLVRDILPKYAAAMGKEATVTIANLENGTEIIQA